MDYCYACRRHLNGAYSCPGCGTPADRLAAPGVAETAQLRAVTDDPDGLADGEPRYGDLPPGGGRAARRLAARGRATRRAGRGRHRATVYGIGAIAVVGAAAMLSVAALSGGSGGDGAPATPLDHNPPAPTSGDITPDTSSPAPAAPAGGAPSSSASTAASPTASDPASPTSTSTSVSGTLRTSAPPPPHSTSPASPSHSPSASPTASRPPTSSPSPSQTPCKPVLWWCD